MKWARLHEGGEEEIWRVDERFEGQSSIRQGNFSEIPPGVRGEGGGASASGGNFSTRRNPRQVAHSEDRQKTSRVVAEVPERKGMQKRSMIRPPIETLTEEGFSQGGVGRAEGTYSEGDLNRKE